MNPGVPNWEAMNQPNTENAHRWDPATGGKPLRSHGQVPASPVRLNGSLRLGPSIALNVRLSAPVPYPTKTGTPTAPAARLNPPSRMNGREQGATQSLLGRHGTRCRGYETDRTPARPGRIPTEPAWLFGRMPPAATRRRLNTRQ